MQGNSPLERWREAVAFLDERSDGPLNKDEFMASIIGALERYDHAHRLVVDAELARRLAHACHESGFLLSAVEKLFLSIAVYPSLSPFSDDNRMEMRFHTILWREATTSLQRKHYPAAVELLFFVAERLSHLGKFNHGRVLLNKTVPYCTTPDEDLHHSQIGQRMGSRENHPGRSPKPPPP